MSTKWKSLIGELCDKSRPQSGKFQLKNLTIFHVYEVEKFDWNALRYFFSTKRKAFAGELFNALCPGSGNV